MYWRKSREWCKFCNSLTPKQGTPIGEYFVCDDCAKSMCGVEGDEYDEGYRDGYDKGYEDAEAGFEARPEDV